MFKALGRTLLALARTTFLTAVVTTTLVGLFVILDRLLLPRDSTEQTT